MAVNLRATILSALLAFGVTGVASAGILGSANGTVPFGLSSVSDNTPGALSATTIFTVGGVNVNGDGTGSFDSCPGPDASMSCSGFAATLMTGTFAGNNSIGQVLTWDGGTMPGQYTYTVTSQNAPAISSGGTGVTFYNISTNGLFTDNRGASGFDSAPASLSITFTENCNVTGGGCSISGGAAFSTPPSFLTGTPEPATMAFIGTGLVALGLIRRRRA